MNAIKVTRGCGASGKSLVAGTVYAVPGDVSRADADLLIRLGKAQAAVMEPPAPTKKTKAARDD